jgi:asparagine synthase (glutamine-hydrolysing)
MITRQMPHLATVPYDRDNRLPHSNPFVFHPHAILQRVKGRINRHLAPVFPEHATLYADYEQWLRTDLRAWAEDILFDPRTLERGLFDPDATRALWERHLSGTELWTIGKVAPLMTIELILRHLVDGDEWPDHFA